MTQLSEVILYAAPSYRSRAYAQAMHAAGIYPNRVLLTPGKEPVWDGPEEISIDLSKDNILTTFKPGEKLTTTFAGTDVVCINTSDNDINSEETVRTISSAEETILIYSGHGGVILRDAVLHIGKKYLHIHGGFAPAFRGSTAFYYSIIQEAMIGATALWLDRDIDTGPILMRKKYPCSGEVEVDRTLDPMVRADLLKYILRERVENGEFRKGEISSEPGTTYFIIHPVLKHIALSRCSLIQSSGLEN